MDTRLNLDTATLYDLVSTAIRLGYHLQVAYVDNQPVNLIEAPIASEWISQANKRMVALQKRVGVY